jgi:hypothetical protein
MLNVSKTRNSHHDRLETYEKWSVGATLRIPLGILIEIAVLAYYVYHSDWKFWSSIAANVLIEPGLAVEFFCIGWTIIASTEAEGESRGKLRRRARSAVAAEQEFLEFRKTRRHVIGPNKVRLAARLKPFAGTEFGTAMSHFEREIGDILWNIEEALHDAGWRQIDWARLPGALPFKRTNRRLAGSALAQNVEIEPHPSQQSVLKPAAYALIDALNSVGIDAGEVPYTPGDRQSSRDPPSSWVPRDSGARTKACPIRWLPTPLNGLETSSFARPGESSSRRGRGRRRDWR